LRPSAHARVADTKLGTFQISLFAGTLGSVLNDQKEQDSSAAAGVVTVDMLSAVVARLRQTVVMVDMLEVAIATSETWQILIGRLHRQSRITHNMKNPPKAS
jgi:hypothetical protein